MVVVVDDKSTGPDTRKRVGSFQLPLNSGTQARRGEQKYATTNC